MMARIVWRIDSLRIVRAMVTRSSSSIIVVTHPFWEGRDRGNEDSMGSEGGNQNRRSISFATRFTVAAAGFRTYFS